MKNNATGSRDNPKPSEARGGEAGASGTVDAKVLVAQTKPTALTSGFDYMDLSADDLSGLRDHSD